jgi:hypothetical protein
MRGEIERPSKLAFIPALFPLMQRYEERGYIVRRAWFLEKNPFMLSRDALLATFTTQNMLHEKADDGYIYGLIKPDVVAY